MATRVEHIAPDRWMARRGRTRAFGLIVGAMAASFAAMSVSVAAAGLGSNAADTAVSSLMMMAIAAPVATVAVRIWRSGLWIAADGVVVRGPLRTWRFSLAEIDRFTTGVTGGGNGTPGIVVRPRTGAPVGVWAMGTEGVYWRHDRYLRDWEPVCEELNALMTQLRLAVTETEASPQQRYA